MSSRYCYVAVLLAIAYAFAVGCSRDAESDLIANLSSSQVEVRREAAYTLAKRNLLEGRAAAALLKTITDPDPTVRAAIVTGLSQHGQNIPLCTVILVTALHDQDQHIQLQAALALQKIAPTSADKNSILTTAMRAGDGKVFLAVGAAGKDGVWAVPTLIEVLSNPAPQLRALAAQTLGRIGFIARPAKSALEQATHDQNQAVQQAARTALEQIQNPGQG
jgi:HEAT repeat protein